MQGAEPGRHWLTLPLWHPAGSLPEWSPDDSAFPESAGGLACFAARRPRLDLSLFPPSPQPPSPPGKGEIFWFSYARGFAPCIPGAEPEAAPAIPAPGERTISNAEVPLPRSPLSLAAGTAHQCRVLTATPCRVSERNLNPASQETKPPPPGTTTAGRASAAPRPALGMQGAKPLA